MELWLVRDVSAWLVGAVLIVGVPAVTLGLDILIHRTLPHRRLNQHNDVTGVIVSLVGVAYAIVIGLCVVSLWEGYTDAKDAVREEAASMTALIPGSVVFDEQTHQVITDGVIRYETALVTDWKARHERGTERERTADLSRLATLVGSLRAETDAQRFYINHAIDKIGKAEQYHHDSDAEADDSRMSPVMWFGVLVSTGAVLTMCLFFGLDDGLVRRALLTMASTVIATNLFLIVEMNYPYYGSFAVTPDSYQSVVDDLRQDN
ncbi:DUF4239 domain-containing protein [Actinoplanes sp. NBRC 103695]|uniref:bestrophin-like domain n=1 Tax=Actinoplanes sp. NBRC 103695 TaxID=3032202 RepID=UPI0024A27FD7|nr:DUF4239 domain-containing protein [Actinoplanes sp. NBRC 103695]GLY99630.1 membrane protein [Actinoplanes sp. NBRC 103695]